MKDEEIILLHYSIDTARLKLGVGWKSTGEVKNIKTWEEINSLNSKLSSQYDAVIRRFDLKKLTEVTEVTSYDNPREITLVSDLINILMELPEEINLKIEEVLSRNERIATTFTPMFPSSFGNEDDLPF